MGLILHTPILKLYAYKQVEKHAVVLCQTEELYLHMPKIDFRTRSMKYLPEIGSLIKRTEKNRIAHFLFANQKPVYAKEVGEKNGWFCRAPAHLC